MVFVVTFGSLGELGSDVAAFERERCKEMWGRYVLLGLRFDGHC